MVGLRSVKMKDGISNWESLNDTIFYIDKSKTVFAKYFIDHKDRELTKKQRDYGFSFNDIISTVLTQDVIDTESYVFISNYCIKTEISDSYTFNKSNDIIQKAILRFKGNDFWPRFKISNKQLVGEVSGLNNPALLFLNLREI